MRRVSIRCGGIGRAACGAETQGGAAEGTAEETQTF